MLDIYLCATYCFGIHVLWMVHFSVDRTRNHKPTRAAVKMMPIGTPRVPYRTPGEGTWQWVDIWNALVSGAL